MLKYHDNFDVFIVDDLLKYQHFVLNTLCEKMSQAVKKNNFMKLSRTFRKKLQRTKKKEKNTFILIKICIIFFITL
jgi:late competence protein required for DNA uptake (superfamily II DNA/RNA helicase)